MTTSVKSTTSSSTLSSLSAKTGMAGLVSGLDTDSLVESLTTANRTKIAKEQQSVTKLGWKQTAYRNVSKALKEFQTKYLDVLSKTNLRSASAYNTTSATASSTKVSVSTTSVASTGNITIDKITQLATSESITSGTVSDPLTGKMESAGAGVMESTDINNLVSNIQGKSILLNLDGKVKTITFDPTFVAAVQADPTTTGLQSALQSKIDSTFGMKTTTDHLITVSVNNDQLGFSATGSRLTISALNSDTTTLSKLGFTDGQSDKLTTNAALNALPFKNNLDSSDTFNVTINSVDFSFNKTDSLATVMSKINASKAGVTLSYSAISDKFALTAKDTGAGDNITFSQSSGNLMDALGLTTATGATKTAGQNAILTVDGVEITRSSNTIDISGVKVELQDVTTTGESPIKITTKADITSMKDTIKNFVADYNAMIETMNKLMTDKADSAYPPLTDEQKASMSEAQINSWEAKAKVGLLQNDSILRGITSNMQSLMYSSAVSGGITLNDLGISSAGYDQNGKLKIDEDQLTTALETKGSQIQELFTTESTGIGNKLNDIINTATKTSGVKGTRGTLIEMAGYESTLSDTENSISDNIKKTNKEITTLKNKLKDQETYYWNKFSALETALSQLNSQSSVLSQFSSGS